MLKPNMASEIRNSDLLKEPFGLISRSYALFICSVFAVSKIIEQIVIIYHNLHPIRLFTFDHSFVIGIELIFLSQHCRIVYLLIVLRALSVLAMLNSLCNDCVF